MFSISRPPTLWTLECGQLIYEDAGQLIQCALLSMCDSIFPKPARWTEVDLFCSQSLYRPPVTKQDLGARWVVMMNHLTTQDDCTAWAESPMTRERKGNRPPPSEPSSSGRESKRVIAVPSHPALHRR